MVRVKAAPVSDQMEAEVDEAAVDRSGTEAGIKLAEGN
jgi:hypothetical protein